MRRAAFLLACTTVLWLHAGAVELRAQTAGTDEVELLRDAAVRESRGDLAEAETLLRRILETRTASVPALLSLERVLRIQGRLDQLVDPLQRALANDPRSALLNQLLVRTYSALDRVEDMQSAASAWIEAVPGIEIPYREVAQLWVARGDYDQARAVLEMGRRRIDRADALALELGDLYAALEQPDLAVREWDRAVGPEARGLTQVRRRLRALPDGGAGMLSELVELMAAEPTTPARLEAATDLAVDAGLERRARELAERVLPLLEPAERAAMAIDIARRADGARLANLAHWAYSRLLDLEEEQGRLLAIRNRLAELALEMGDTASAAAAYRVVEAAYEQGTPQRRQAAALRIELLAGQDPDGAVEALREFRRDYADAPETDRLAAAAAAGLLGAGRTDEARMILAGVRGPQSALLRGRLALQRGDVEASRLEYMSAAPSLEGGRATRVLTLVTLLGRVSPDGALALGEALRLQSEGTPGEALDTLLAATPALPAADRAPILEFAAALAEDMELPADAREIRRTVLADYPHSAEAPAALLALARSLLSETGGASQARELLERLIIEYPRSALVPQARRELQRLGRAGEVGEVRSPE